MNHNIFIAANSRDASALAVAEEIEKQGFEPFLYESDKIADGSEALTISIGGAATGLAVSYGTETVDLASIGAAWFRRPNYFTGELRDKGYQLSIAPEYRAIQQGIWDAIPENVWLSHPERLRRAETKFTQLRMAAEVGFVFPDTVASNRWAPIHDMLSDEIMFKPAYGVLYEKDELKMMYVRAFKNRFEDLPQGMNPYPGLWQSRKEKYREWRITVVGEEFFDAAIYTDNNAKDDWRRLQSTDAVSFKAERFPDEHKKKCLAYLALADLRYGAFDFIEGSDGSMTFLECNPNGQYGWLEDQLGLPISRAIATELVTIAQK